MATNGFSTKLFRVSRKAGYCFIRDDSGRYLPLEDIYSVIQGLEAVLEKGMEQKELEEFLYSQSIKEISESANWLFGGSASAFSTIHPTRRGDDTHSGECVYFIVSPARKGEIKIGFSEDVYSRVKTFNRQYKKPCHCVAVAQTPDYKYFETALHREFKSCCIDGEWFALNPVYEWLREVLRAKNGSR